MHRSHAAAVSTPIGIIKKHFTELPEVSPLREAETSHRPIFRTPELRMRYAIAYKILKGVVDSGTHKVEAAAIAIVAEALGCFGGVDNEKNDHLTAAFKQLEFCNARDRVLKL